MKVLQINVRYNYGSTGKITKDIHYGLMERGYESVVLYGRIDKTDDKNVYKVCNDFYSKLNNLWSRFTGVMYGGCYFSTRKIIEKIKEEKPDIVHLQCINGYFVNIYKLLEWLKTNNYKTVLTLHAEFMYTANCGHALECEKWKTGCNNCPRNREVTKSWIFDSTSVSWKKMKNAFEGFDNLEVVSVSPWLKNRATQSPMFSDKNNTVVYNGLNTEVFGYLNRNDVKRKYCSDDELMVLHVTASFSDKENDIKGGHYLIKLAEQCKNEKIKFIVAGPYHTTGKLPENIILLGNISDQNELAELYSAADLTILLSKRETFSMVVAESLCCGTPVVGFKAGAPEQIAIREYCKFVKYGDIEDLKEAIIDIVNEKHDKNEISAIAEGKYSETKMVEEYINLYRRNA